MYLHASSILDIVRFVEGLFSLPRDHEGNNFVGDLVHGLFSGRTIFSPCGSVINCGGENSLSEFK